MIRDNTLYKALPNEYQQVEYLRSTADNQYINTGYYVDGNKSVMEVDFQPLISSSSEQRIISGAYRSARFYISVNTNSKITFGLGGGYNNTTNIDTNRHVAIIDAYNLTATFDGVNYPANNGAYSHFTNTNNWIGIMGGQGSNSTTMQYIKMKFYEMKLYEYEEVIQERDGSSYTTIQKMLIHHYIPCLRKSDNKTGVYDLVAEEFKATSNGNSQYGDFIFPETSEVNSNGRMYVGVAGTAKEIIDVYAGLSNPASQGIATRVKKIYAGDTYGVARLVYHAPILPSAYQQVEYLESTGTQRINTNHSVSTSDALKVDFQITDLAKIGSDEYPYIAGVYKTSKKRFHISLNLEVDDIVLGIGVGYAHSGDTNLNRHLAIINMGQLKAYLDGMEILATSESSDYTKAADGTIQLFGTQGSATTTIHYSKVKIYHARIGVMDSSGIWTSIDQDFYPCYRKSDGEPGMYDIINNVFYTNAGTGTFLYGNKYVKEL